MFVHTSKKGRETYPVLSKTSQLKGKGIPNKLHTNGRKPKIPSKAKTDKRNEKSDRIKIVTKRK